MLSDRIDVALSPLNEVTDTVVNSASIASEKLKQGQDEVLSLPTTVMNDTYKKINSAVTDVQLEVNNVVNNYLNPVKTLAPEVTDITQGIQDITNNIITPFEVAGEGIEDITNFVSNIDGVICNSISSAAQGAMSQMTGMMTSIQRSAVAATAKATADVLGVVKGTLSLPVQVLPKITKGIKKAIEPKISSVLGPLSTFSSIVESLPNGSGGCDALLNSNLITSNLSSLLNQTSLGKDLLSKLLDSLINTSNKVVTSSKNNIYTKLDEWILSPYVEDSIINSTNTVNNGISSMEEACIKVKDILDNPGSILLYPSEEIVQVNSNFEHLKDIIYKYCNNLSTYEDLVGAANRVADDLFILSELAVMTNTSIPCNSEDTIRNLPEHILTAKNLNNGFCVASEFIEIVQDIQDETNRCIQMIYAKNDQFKDNLTKDLDNLIERLEALKPLVDEVKEDMLENSNSSFDSIVDTAIESYDSMIKDLSESLEDAKEYAGDIFDNIIGVAAELVETEEQESSATRCDR